MKPGIVFLVGSGPGDPGLLTVRAVELLGKADVVVYDKLANFSFLSHLRPGVELIDVGKQSDQHTMTQDRINMRLVELAQQGKRVVRLKGGDPYVFGRGGEEAEVLVAHNIPFEVVSGVTSSIAVPASAGIPVTHRDHCTSFHVITGHERAEREGSAIDYAVLAALPGTLVFLMGVKNLEQIARQLVSQGKSPSTPVAVIERGCTARQRQVIGTLETIAQVVTDAKIGSPAVTVVGTVVGLSSILSQTGLHLPLRGQRVLVTRTRKQAGRLSEKLRAQGADALEIPLIRIEPNLDASLWDSLFSKLSQANWLVFTSENGVDIFLEQMRNRRQDVRSLNALRIAAVGPATADRLLVAGLVADVVPTVFTVEALSQTMLPLVTPGMRVVLARADIANPEIHSTLVSVGCLVDDFPIYRTLPEPAFHAILADLLRQGEIDWITFASSSTVDAFMLALGDHRDLLGATQFACIGPVTAQTARKHGLPIAAEAKVYTLDGLVQAIGDNLSASSEVLS